MNANEIARIAAAVNLLRPEWPTESLQTFITNKLGHRPYRDAAVALAWIATEPESKTPARVLEAGPWWKVGAEEREPLRSKRCHVCGDFVPGGYHRQDDPCQGPPVVSRTSSWAMAARAELRPSKVIDRAAEAARRVEEVQLPSEERA